MKPDLFFKKKKVLITGGAGFIGSHLCNRLLSYGAHVTCVDNLSTGYKENIIPHRLNPLFGFINHDVVLPFDVDCDFIFHLASPASPKKYQSNPIGTLKTNVLGTLNILELARVHKASMLFASTSEVYGDPLVHPQPESYFGNVNPNGPRACYDEGKRCAETFIYNYQAQYGLDVKVARLFNTYGPQMSVDDGRVIPAFIKSLLAGENLLIEGDGLQTRSFCYVDDTINALIALMIATNIKSPVNVGNDEEVSILALAQMLTELIPSSNSRFSFTEKAQDDPKKRRPCLKLAHELLSWSPEVKLQDGLLQTVKYFKKNAN